MQGGAGGGLLGGWRWRRHGGSWGWGGGKGEVCGGVMMKGSWGHRDASEDMGLKSGQC